jgi:hypothetical protein
VPNPIIHDNFPAHRPVKSQTSDAGPGRRAADGTSERPASGAAANADVERAQRRLMLERGTVTDPAIADLEAARARVARLRAQMAADPLAAMRAHGRLDTEALQAAVARPTA